MPWESTFYSRNYVGGSRLLLHIVVFILVSVVLGSIHAEKRLKEVAHGAVNFEDDVEDVAKASMNSPENHDVAGNHIGHAISRSPKKNKDGNSATLNAFLENILKARDELKWIDQAAHRIKSRDQPSDSWEGDYSSKTAYEDDDARSRDKRSFGRQFETTHLKHRKKYDAKYDKPRRVFLDNDIMTKRGSVGTHFENGDRVRLDRPVRAKGAMDDQRLNDWTRREEDPRGFDDRLNSNKNSQSSEDNGENRWLRDPGDLLNARNNDDESDKIGDYTDDRIERIADAFDARDHRGVASARSFRKSPTSSKNSTSTSEIKSNPEDTATSLDSLKKIVLELRANLTKPVEDPKKNARIADLSKTRQGHVEDTSGKKEGHGKGEHEKRIHQPLRSRERKHNGRQKVDTKASLWEEQGEKENDAVLRERKNDLDESIDDTNVTSRSENALSIWRTKRANDDENDRSEPKLFYRTGFGVSYRKEKNSEEFRSRRRRSKEGFVQGQIEARQIELTPHATNSTTSSSMENAKVSDDGAKSECPMTTSNQTNRDAASSNFVMAVTDGMSLLTRKLAEDREAPRSKQHEKEWNLTEFESIGHDSMNPLRTTESLVPEVKLASDTKEERVNANYTGELAQEEQNARTKRDFILRENTTDPKMLAKIEVDVVKAVESKKPFKGELEGRWKDEKLKIASIRVTTTEIATGTSVPETESVTSNFTSMEERKSKLEAKAMILKDKQLGASSSMILNVAVEKLHLPVTVNCVYRTNGSNVDEKLASREKSWPEFGRAKFIGNVRGSLRDEVKNSYVKAERTKRRDVKRNEITSEKGNIEAREAVNGRMDWKGRAVKEERMERLSESAGVSEEAKIDRSREQEDNESRVERDARDARRYTTRDDNEVQSNNYKGKRRLLEEPSEGNEVVVEPSVNFRSRRGISTSKVKKSTMDDGKLKNDKIDMIEEERRVKKNSDRRNNIDERSSRGDENLNGRYNEVDEDAKKELFSNKRSSKMVGKDRFSYEKKSDPYKTRVDMLIRQRMNSKNRGNGYYGRIKRQPGGMIEYYDYDGEDEEQNRNAPWALESSRQSSPRAENRFDLDVKTEERGNSGEKRKCKESDRNDSDNSNKPTIDKKNEKAEKERRKGLKKAQLGNKEPKQEFIVDLGSPQTTDVTEKNGKPSKSPRSNVTSKESSERPRLELEKLFQIEDASATEAQSNWLMQSNRMEESDNTQHRDRNIVSEPLEYILRAPENIERNMVDAILDDIQPIRLLGRNGDPDVPGDPYDNYAKQRHGNAYYQNPGQRQHDNISPMYEELQKMYDWGDAEVRNGPRLRGDQRMHNEADDNVESKDSHPGLFDEKFPARDEWYLKQADNNNGEGTYSYVSYVRDEDQTKPMQEENRSVNAIQNGISSLTNGVDVSTMYSNRYSDVDTKSATQSHVFAESTPQQLPKPNYTNSSGSDYMALKSTDDLFKGGVEQGNATEERTLVATTTNMAGNVTRQSSEIFQVAEKANNSEAMDAAKESPLSSKIIIETDSGSPYESANNLNFEYRRSNGNFKDDDINEHENKDDDDDDDDDENDDREKQSVFESKDLHESFVEPLDWADDFDDDIKVRLGRGLKTIEDKPHPKNEDTKELRNNETVGESFSSTMEDANAIRTKGRYPDFLGEGTSSSSESFITAQPEFSREGTTQFSRRRTTREETVQSEVVSDDAKIIGVVVESSTLNASSLKEHEDQSTKGNDCKRMAKEEVAASLSTLVFTELTESSDHVVERIEENANGGDRSNRIEAEKASIEKAASSARRTGQSVLETPANSNVSRVKREEGNVYRTSYVYPSPKELHAPYYDRHGGANVATIDPHPYEFNPYDEARPQDSSHLLARRDRQDALHRKQSDLDEWKKKYRTMERGSDSKRRANTAKRQKKKKRRKRRRRKKKKKDKRKLSKVSKKHAQKVDNIGKVDGKSERKNLRKRRHHKHGDEGRQSGTSSSSSSLSSSSSSSSVSSPGRSDAWKDSEARKANTMDASLTVRKGAQAGGKLASHRYHGAAYGESGDNLVHHENVEDQSTVRPDDDAPRKRLEMLLTVDNTEDESQMDLALHGELAGRIVEQIFEQVRKNEALKVVLGPGLYRRNKPEDVVATDRVYRRELDEDEARHTETMMRMVMELLGRLILDEVERKTCVSLPPDMQNFLEWMLGVDRNQMELQEEASPPLPLVHDQETPGHFPSNGKFLFPTLNGGETDTDINVLRKKVRILRNLIDEYNTLSEKEKMKIHPVHDYLVRQLTLLLKYIEAKEESLSHGGRDVSAASRGNILQYQAAVPNNDINSTKNDILLPRAANVPELFKFGNLTLGSTDQRFRNDVAAPSSYAKHRNVRSSNVTSNRRRLGQTNNRKKRKRRRRKHRKQKHGTTSSRRKRANLYENDGQATLEPAAYEQPSNRSSIDKQSNAAFKMTLGNERKDEEVREARINEGRVIASERLERGTSKVKLRSTDYDIEPREDDTKNDDLDFEEEDAGYDDVDFKSNGDSSSTIARRSNHRQRQDEDNRQETGKKTKRAGKDEGRERGILSRSRRISSTPSNGASNERFAALEDGKDDAPSQRRSEKSKRDVSSASMNLRAWLNGGKDFARNLSDEVDDTRIVAEGNSKSATFEDDASSIDLPIKGKNRIEDEILLLNEREAWKKENKRQLEEVAFGKDTREGAERTTKSTEIEEQRVLDSRREKRANDRNKTAIDDDQRRISPDITAKSNDNDNIVKISSTAVDVSTEGEVHSSSTRGPIAAEDALKQRVLTDGEILSLLERKINVYADDDEGKLVARTETKAPCRNVNSSIASDPYEMVELVARSKTSRSDVTIEGSSSRKEKGRFDEATTRYRETTDPHTAKETPRRTVEGQLEGINDTLKRRSSHREDVDANDGGNRGVGGKTGREKKRKKYADKRQSRRDDGWWNSTVRMNRFAEPELDSKAARYAKFEGSLGQNYDASGSDRRKRLDGRRRERRIMPINRNPYYDRGRFETLGGEWYPGRRWDHDGGFYLYRPRRRYDYDRFEDLPSLSLSSSRLLADFSDGGWEDEDELEADDYEDEYEADADDDAMYRRYPSVGFVGYRPYEGRFRGGGSRKPHGKWSRSSRSRKGRGRRVSLKDLSSGRGTLWGRKGMKRKGNYALPEEREREERKSSRILGENSISRENRTKDSSNGGIFSIAGGDGRKMDAKVVGAKTRIKRDSDNEGPAFESPLMISLNSL